MRDQDWQCGRCPLKEERAILTSDQLLADMKLLHPKLIDLSLGRVERLLAKLGNPHKSLPPVIHIAGTNGKGSVTAYLKAMLTAAGKRVHVYTSPHLVRFHERIELASAPGLTQPIAEADLVDVLSRTQAVNSGDDITQFEITTAAAFLAFAEHPADIVLLEVGLGGRLDATNVIAKPTLTVITPISLDHAEKLGGTIESIATEKAGILKRGVECIVSQQEDSVHEVIAREATRVGANLFVWGQNFDAYEQRGRLIVQKSDHLLDLPLPALIGRHQIINAGTAVAAALELKDVVLDEASIERGLVNARWPARMQRIDSGPLPSLLKPGSELWLDGGHNPAAGLVIAQSLADLEERAPKPLYLVVGMLGLKDAPGFLGPFRGLARHVVGVPIPGAHEAPFSPDALADAARSVSLSAEAAPSVEAALKRIEAIDAGPKRILITGSLYLAGHVLALQEGVEPQAN
ncbi:bifunctional folylpolyglutamate synthase/dihydrofolate synthase [Hyphomicrobium zavarzinii]|uniref:bifunctional folylpolyglutamate synthase/dihydrofolate synthase n=2 Tax=Hyphomicrobium TaxID=81 RepID=UPI001FD9FFE3|nr:folylpolyglutamate synthase/dihydrofolate synthase family protein [Hyphomicrobium zavarzinii]HML43359.1 folylpolyglutamate synthase/dihydrofolate synthase family protein [Hyphomicrobium zavarzinii]